MIFAFPAILICSITKNWVRDPKSFIFKELEEKRCTEEVMLKKMHVRQMYRSRNLIIKRRFGGFLEGISLDEDLSFLTYPCYFMLRRFLMAVMLVVFRKFLWMQIFLKAMTIVTAVILIGEANYFETRFKQR